MKVLAAEIDPYGAPLIVAIVASEYTEVGLGDDLLKRLQPYFPARPIMLVSIEHSGYRAYAPFETHRILALIQLEQLIAQEIDLSIPPPEEEEPLPF